MALMRWDIINHFIKKNNYISYVEIGYYKGWSFDRIGNDFIEKHAIDPNPSKTGFYGQEDWEYGSTHDISEYYDGRRHYIHKMTSDEYFSQLHPHQKYDIFFIDGLHESSQVDRDIQNALKHLNEGGVIIMHDCNPSTEEMTTTGTANGEWTGDVYKTAIALKFDFKEGDFYVVDTDYGVGVLKPSGFLPFKPTWIGNWKDFDKNREFFLNLISPEEFLEREK